MLTPDLLRSIMPRLPAAKNAAYFPALAAAMAEFAIEAPARAAAFLAQLAHESGQLRFMEEIWGPTPAQKRYEPTTTLATSLGNTDPGDGLRFKGRGPIQITGRANYRRFGDLLGVDLVKTPASAAAPELAFRIAALFWSKKGLNELADQGTDDAFREITRRINGGFNGLADRQQLYAAARAALGVTDAPVTRGATRGAPPPLPAEPEFERGYEAVRAALIGTEGTEETKDTKGNKQKKQQTTKKKTTTNRPLNKSVKTGARKTTARRKTAARKTPSRKTPVRKRTRR